jgi:surfactin synthase thioesterase subunit
LTKLGYLIDNPWSNALDRAKAAGLILADVLAKKQMGARPITLVGFSLGARVIYYALLELHRQKAFGLVQNVYMIGAPVSPSRKNWLQARAMVAGRFVNGECLCLHPHGQG